jgi:hypothetical protein
MREETNTLTTKDTKEHKHIAYRIPLIAKDRQKGKQDLAVDLCGGTVREKTDYGDTEARRTEKEHQNRYR